MGVKAVHFEATTRLQNGNISAFLPSSDQYFFFSYWYRSSTTPPNTGQYIIASLGDHQPGAPGALYASDVLVYHVVDGGNVKMIANFSVAVDVFNGHYSLTFDNDPVIPYDGGWHNVMVSVDVLNRVGHYAIDNVVGAYVADPVGDPFSIPWNLIDSYNIGAVDDPLSNNGAYTGDLAELFLLVGTSIDITDPDVRAKFIDPDTLLPVAIDAGGLWPFFDSLGAIPQIWLSGNQDLFPRNYPGWTATCVSQFDSDPTSQFSVAAGNLTTADSDPFGSTNVGV